MVSKRNDTHTYTQKNKWTVPACPIYYNRCSVNIQHTSLRHPLQTMPMYPRYTVQNGFIFPCKALVHMRRTRPGELLFFSIQSHLILTCLNSCSTTFILTRFQKSFYHTSPLYRLSHDVTSGNFRNAI